MSYGKFTKEELVEAAEEHLDTAKFEFLVKANKCPMCKHRIKGYLSAHKTKDGFLLSRVNLTTLLHFKDTHGIPAYVVMTFIRSMYKTEVARSVFDKNYKFLLMD